jgi:uncharacterized delta-60 repeat protein
MKKITSFLATLLLSLTTLLGNAQTEGSLDLTFTPPNNTYGPCALQADGKILTADGTTKPSRLNPDGTLDNTFNVGSGVGSYNIFDLGVQSDGKIIIVGNFYGFNGSNTAKYITRLNTDGSLDNTFSIGTGLTYTAGGLQSPQINKVLILPNGKIIISGQFNSYNGNAANGIARLNTDGSFDNTFNMGSGFTSGGYAVSIALQSDGKIVMAGNFQTYNGADAKYILRINADGSLDNTFSSITSTSGGFVINSIKVQPDNKVLVVGNFTSYNGTTTTRGLIRLNGDGTIDNAFITANGTGINDPVNQYYLYDVVPQASGKIIIGGTFTTFNSVSRNNITRLNSDGSLDNTFVIGTGFTGSIHLVRNLLIDASNKILVSGNFTTYNGVTIKTLCRLNAGCATYTITNPQTICSYGSYSINGNTYTSAGSYMDILQTSNGCDSVVNTVLTVTDITAFSAPLSDVIATTGTNAQFNATTSTSGANYNWQTNVAGLGWLNLINNATYTGVNTTALQVTNLKLANHEQKFRIIQTKGLCADTSTIAKISITDTTINVINDTIYTTVTDTLIINATITGASAPNNVNTLKIYPNPANDILNIETGNFSLMNGYSLTIENTIGQQVFNTSINQANYQLDLSTWTGTGLYFVKIIDDQSNLIVNRKIILQ